MAWSNHSLVSRGGGGSNSIEYQKKIAMDTPEKSCKNKYFGWCIYIYIYISIYHTYFYIFPRAALALRSFVRFVLPNCSPTDLFRCPRFVRPICSPDLRVPDLFSRFALLMYSPDLFFRSRYPRFILPICSPNLSLTSRCSESYAGINLSVLAYFPTKVQPDGFLHYNLRIHT